MKNIVLLFLFIICQGASQHVSAQCLEVTPQLQGTVLCPGDEVELIATSGFAAYRWYYSFINSNTGGTLYAENQGILTLDAAEWANTYWYVEVASAECQLPSATVYWDLWVFLNPGIAHDINTTLCPGDSALISSAFPGPLNFQWYNNFQEIPGATASSYWVKQPGFYTLSVSYAECPDYFLGSGIGPEFNFYPELIPVIEQEPQAEGILLGVQGINNPQWLLDGAPIEGANSPSHLATVEGIYSVSGNDSNGCTVLSAPLELNSLSVHVEAPVALEVYPNPFAENINIAYSGPRIVYLRIFDLSGKEVHTVQGPLPYKYDIRIPSSGTGLYFLELTYEHGGRSTHKLVRR